MKPTEMRKDRVEVLFATWCRDEAMPKRDDMAGVSLTESASSVRANASVMFGKQHVESTWLMRSAF
jgi:hypothetical protein